MRSLRCGGASLNDQKESTKCERGGAGWWERNSMFSVGNLSWAGAGGRGDASGRPIALAGRRGFRACRFLHALVPSKCDTRLPRRQRRLRVRHLYDEDLPPVAVRVLDPDLVLEGVAAVGTVLLVEREPRAAQALGGRPHRLGRRHLDAEMRERSGRRCGALVESQVEGGLGHVELCVARVELDRLEPEEGAIESDGLLELRRVQCDVDLE